MTCGDTLGSFFTKPGYQHRTDPAYHDDREYISTDIVHQPDAYSILEFLGLRFGADTVIDIGCGAARKLLALTGFGTRIGVDHGPNLEFCRQNHPNEQWIEIDLENQCVLPIADDVITRSVVICADVVEHLKDPTNLLTLLADLSRRAKAVIITTPERDLVRGPGDLGPPKNTSHVREWTIDEFGQLLTSHGLAPTFLGLTVNNNQNLEKKTILALCDQCSCSDGQRVPDDFHPLAIVATYNDADIAPQTIVKLLKDGIHVHVLDNWSSDGTFEQMIALAYCYPALIVERFPASGPSRYYEWHSILRKKEDIGTLHPGRWIIHTDSDEIRCSPWAGISFRSGLWIAERMGYSAIDFTVCDFRPIDDRFVAGKDPEVGFQHFEFGRRPGHFSQVKVWRQGAERVDLASTGGHQAEFPGKMVFPYKFLLKHYPLRNSEQARRKVFTERIGRFSPYERQALGWHIHYDSWKFDTQFLWSAADLLEFDEQATRRLFLTEMLSGIGIVR
jgi:2-polyprenyl-3-methyl-5-hydroxy-6-metoxy-1,4-benzoquinol methylase